MTNNVFLQACRKESVARIPVWYMRQAGRYDPDYRKIKEKYSLLDICRNPELATEVTLMPVRKLGVDAAILYSDIMNPVAGIGVDFDIVPQVGPVIEQPIRTKADVERLYRFEPAKSLPHVLETIRILTRELKVPLITFVGAPFTLASYLIEGSPSKNHWRTKTLMYRDPHTWYLLMEKLGDMVIAYLHAQVAAGADAVQVFDSWVGVLSPADFRLFALPTIARIFTEIKALPVPKIYFPGVSSGELLPELASLQADVISLDWRVSIREGRRRLGHRFAIQGNLDPTVLMGTDDWIRQRAREIIDQGMEQQGYIFNLGHGLFPEVSLDKLKMLTEEVHQYSEQQLLLHK